MLSSDQLTAVQHKEGPAMVLAGPGSGKTMVITNRILYLIRQGVRPENILVITFTRAAARQMQERFARLAQPDHFRVTFGTFHAVFFQILKNAYGYTAENILREDERFRIMTSIAQELHLEYGDMNEWAGDVLAEISRVKAEQIPLDHYYASSVPEEEFRKVCRMYTERQAKLGRIDFDDMCVYTYDLFHARTDILKAWQDHFRYILIDEFQDINMLQYRIIRLLASPRNNLFIVGDDDQSIYRFRGSRPEIMLNFPKDYPGTAVMKLNENYRSTPQIVAASAHVIAQNRTRYHKDLYSRKKAGPPVEVMECRDMETELFYLVNCIRSSLQDGIAPSQIAVLTRTNLEGRAPAAKLSQFQIPCRMKDAAPILWDHWIARDFLSYLNLAHGPMEREDFLRVCNKPNRYMTRDSAYAKTITFPGLYGWYSDRPWMAERIREFESTLRMLRDLRPYTAINYLRRGAGYDAYLQDYARKRRIDYEELLQTADEIQDSAKECETVGVWREKIDQIREQMKEQQKAGMRQEGEFVTLATLHSAKGLEFMEVFLLNVNEGVIPYRRASLESEIEEERRLFYVGMTRAKKKLHLFYVKERYNRKMEPSRYLECLKPGDKPE